MNAQIKQLESGAHLDSFLRAKSVALIGATERSIWSTGTFANFGRLGFRGQVHVVNPKGGVIHGLSAAASCRTIGEVVDAALLMVPMKAIPDAFGDMRESGIRNAVILTSGFAEMGSDGASRQQALASLARENGITLLGPNCLGFVNYVDSVPIWTVGLPTELRGNVAVVSQSGATAAYISEFAGRQAVGLSYIVSTGNEADLNVARVVDYLVDDPATKVICVFLETSRDALTLAAAAQRALAADKPIIAIKIGTSEVTAKAAQAHTGSLVGDDRVFDAACRQLGIIRVHSIDDLVATAALLSQVRPVAGGKLGALAISGGICEIAADRAEAVGLPLAELSEPTRAALREVMPEFGTPHNPLDVTGAAMLDPSLFERSIVALADDTAIGMVACLCDMPKGPEETLAELVIAHVGAAFRGIDKPGVMLSVTPRDVPEYARDLAVKYGVPYLAAGVDRGLAAIFNALWWSAKRAVPSTSMEDEPRRDASPARPCSEREVLEFLSAQGVPVIPARVATSAAEAEAFARAQDGPVVMKIAPADIAHKSEVGGVRLGVADDEAALVYEDMRTSVAQALPNARIDGIIVSPMREKGVELLVGIVRDPQWGPAIAVGLGGIWVELLKDSSLRRLPVSPDDVLEMLGELRSSKLLDGYRGTPPVDRRRIAEVVAMIGDAALALGPQLASLEVNPLLATTERVEALDGLAIWEDGEAA